MISTEKHGSSLVHPPALAFIWPYLPSAPVIASLVPGAILKKLPLSIQSLLNSVANGCNSMWPEKMLNKSYNSSCYKKSNGPAMKPAHSTGSL